MEETKKKKLVDFAGIALAAVLAGVGVWMAMGDGGEEAKESALAAKAQPTLNLPKKEDLPIAETTEEIAHPPTEIQSVEESFEPGTMRNVAWNRPDNWDQLTRAEKTRAQPIARVIKPVGWDDRKLFSQPSDKKIERLMRAQPGKLVLGTITYNEKFVSDFLESLKTPIEFSAEDSEEDRAIKQAVIDARADLKAAYDRGEDIVEIMNATENELHNLAAYRINLQSTIHEYRKGGEHTEQEIQDYIKAANTILEENGIEPLRLGEIWFRKAQYESAIDQEASE